MGQLEKDLKSLAGWLKDNGIDFKVVGSLALKVCGLPMNREPHDIDIEAVAPCEIPFKVLADSQGNAYYKELDAYSANGHKPYIFKWGETLVNVWCVKDYSSDRCVWKDYIKYDVVSEVIKRKMKYGRVKDYKDLIASINSLLTE